MPQLLFRCHLSTCNASVHTVGWWWEEQEGQKKSVFYKCTLHRHPISALIMFQHGFFDTTSKEINVQRTNQWNGSFTAKSVVKRMLYEQIKADLYLTWQHLLQPDMWCWQEENQFQKKEWGTTCKKTNAIARQPWRRQWRRAHWYCQCQRTGRVTDTGFCQQKRSFWLQVE